MIPRLSEGRIRAALEDFPVIALLGPRQVGKTTLALAIAKTITLGDLTQRLGELTQTSRG